MKRTTKKYLEYLKHCIIFLIIILAIYLLRLPISMFLLNTYSQFSKSNKAELFIGEYYHSLSFNIEKIANNHFKKALTRHKSKLNNSQITPDERHLTEYLIGNSYECGKGTEINLNIAKFWYKKATKSSNVNIARDATTALKRIENNQTTTCKK